MGGSKVDREGNGYSFDYELNETELSGNTTLYRVNTAGGGVSGNVTFNPDFSSRTINPQAFITSIPLWIWVILGGVVAVGFFFARRK